MKKSVLTSISAAVHEDAKSKGLNISYELEKALKAKLNGKIDDSDEDIICKFCGVKGVRQTKENINQKDACLWLFPDECWCCNRCFNHKSKKLELTIATKSG